MRCPRCDVQIKDADAAFCPRCGGPLGAPDAAATTELKQPTGSVPERDADEGAGTSAPAPQGSTRPLEVPDPAPPSDTSGEPGLLTDLRESLAVRARHQGWGEIVVAGLFGFMVAMACAAVLVAAAKLQYPFLGRGAGPLDILSASGIAALGILGTPVHVGEAIVTAIPLGALALVGWALVWASARFVRHGPAVTLTAAVKDGMRVALPFAVLCTIAALVFRFPGRDGAWVEVLPAALLGLLWGALFGALGGIIAMGGVRRNVSLALAKVKDRSVAAYEGVRAAGVMVFVATALATVAVVLWFLVQVFTDLPPGAGIKGAIAALVYLVAFGPNAVGAALALAHGGPITYGAQVTASGKMVGTLEDVSLFDWPAPGAPWPVFLLLAVPVLACLLGGFNARRSTERTGDVARVLITAAAVYAGALCLLAIMSEARLGAGLIRNRGFARLAPDPWVLLLLAFSWAVVLGFVGWRLRDTQPDPEKR